MLTILTVNLGSSSLRAGLYQTVEQRSPGEDPVADVTCTDSFASQIPDVATSLTGLREWLGDCTPTVVGHRIVHGGQDYSEPVLVTTEVLTALRRLEVLDPTHMPLALAAIEATRVALPSAVQVACFDTAFHRHMAPVAQMYPLPRVLRENGLVRYGFHGLSCEFIMAELTSLNSAEARRRVIIAHLGNGSSMTAVRDGRTVDTTMGLTPAGGLVMGSRSGDLDPGVLAFLIDARLVGPDELGHLVNHRSGMLAVSETTADMRVLLEQEETDPRARAAIELYCYQARKFVGALATTMAGVDTLVFTGGIGENAAPVRRRICSGLEFLGVAIDEDRNLRDDNVISRASAMVTVRVTHTDEDLMIARHAARIVTIGEPQYVSI